jgi:two-component system, OmpR family, sensor kinase
VKLPLRVRLTALFSLGMAVVLTGFGAFVYQRLGRDLLASVDLGLRAHAQVVTDRVHQGVAGLSSGRSLIDPDESFAQVLDASGQVVDASSDLSEASLLTPGALRTITRPTFVSFTVPTIDVDPIRVLAVPVVSPGGTSYVLVGATLGDRKDALWALVLSLAIGGPVALILASGAAWLVIGGALRPVEQMRKEAAAVSASEPSRRLPVPATGDELARLGATLNAMLDRLQQAMVSERQFVDNASHELRTPLSVLKTELELALSRSRSPEELRQALANASVETDRLVRLSEDLLVLARMEHGRVPLARREVSVRELVSETAAPYGSRARTAGARIILEVDSVRVSADPVRLRQALENLLDNALRHVGGGGVITVRSKHENGAVSLTVEDTGPGFDSAILESAFEPFSRSPGTQSGNGSVEGAGLGLAIVKAVAEAHGGTAKAENSPAGGARVVLLFPG